MRRILTSKVEVFVWSLALIVACQLLVIGCAILALAAGAP